MHYYPREDNHFSLDFCTLIITLNLHQPINHLKWWNKASLATGPLRCLLLSSVNASPPSSCIFFSLLSPICTLGTQSEALDHAPWKTKLITSNQILSSLIRDMKGLTRISKDSGMQTFLKITFFLCAAGSCSLIPPHHKRRKSSLCFLLPALPPPLHSMSSLPLEFQKSILVFRAQTTLNKGKQYRLMSPENRKIYIC